MPASDDCRRILGIDPGTRAVGWGVVERAGPRLVEIAHGTLRAKATLPIEERLAILAAGLRTVLATHAPREAAIEEVFYGRDARAAQRLGEARGALLLVLAEAELPVAHYANNVVKKAVTGQGRATKEQVSLMLRRVLALEARPHSLDASDALALAVCHHQRPDLPGGGAAGVPARLTAAIDAARRKDRDRRRLR